MRRLRNLTRLAGLAVALAGCQQPLVMTEADYVYYNKVSGDYDHARYEHEPIVPPGEPRTVADPTRKEQWKLTVGMAKRIAIENNKQIAVVSTQPGQAGSQIDLRLGEFDAFYHIGGSWGLQDQQVNNNIQVFGTGQNAIRTNVFGAAAGGIPFGGTPGGSSDGDGANPALLTTDVFGITKRNATGGITRLSYSLDYQRISPVSPFILVNPSWTNSLNLAFSQPVLQGAGVEFNRSRILIARATYEQSVRDFDTNVRTLLRDVELRYWQLHFTYQDLHSREVGMKQALATWQKEKNKEIVGTGSTVDVAQAREQYEFFHSAWIQALSRVLAAERELRESMGLPPDDDRQIVPADEPTIAGYTPNWRLGVLEAMEQRPELASQRFVVRANELEVMRQKNGLLPDLSVFATYRISGLDNQFDQAFDRMTDNTYASWTLGFQWRRQIGERSAHASVRRANLALSQQRATLRNLEHTILHDLHEAFQNIVSAYELIHSQKSRRDAAAAQLEAREQFYRQGRTTIDLLLQAQSVFADALRDESQAIVQYNQALISWEFAKGTILQSDNVTVAERGYSLMPAEDVEARQNSWLNAIMFPIFSGDQPRGDAFPCPDGSGPLYSPKLWTPTTEPTAAEADAAAANDSGDEAKKANEDGKESADPSEKDKTTDSDAKEKPADDKSTSKQRMDKVLEELERDLRQGTEKDAKPKSAPEKAAPKLDAIPKASKAAKSAFLPSPRPIAEPALGVPTAMPVLPTIPTVPTITTVGGSANQPAAFPTLTPRSPVELPPAAK